MDATAISKLKTPVKQRVGKTKSGKTYKYYDIEDIKEKLNDAFNYEWSDELISTDIREDGVLVSLKISAKSLDTVIGGIEYFSHAGIAFEDAKVGVSTGDTLKSAYTTAFKNAARSFGIGTYNASTPVSEIMSSSTQESVKETVVERQAYEEAIFDDDIPAFTDEAAYPKAKAATVEQKKPYQPFNKGGYGNKQQGNYASSDKPISPLQASTLKGMCAKKGMSVSDYVNAAISLSDIDDFNQLNSKQASAVISFYKQK